MGVLKSLIMLDEETIEITYHDKIKIELEDLRQAWKEFDKFAGEKRLKKLIVVGRETDITYEARKFVDKESIARKKNIIAEAILLHTLPQKMIANFYSNFIKGAYPIKYFTDNTEARKWLDSIKD